MGPKIFMIMISFSISSCLGHEAETLTSSLKKGSGTGVFVENETIATEPRIRGGKEATIEEFPWMAGVYFRDSGSFIGGASIITERHLLTAAHVVKVSNTDVNVNPKEIAVFMGSTYKKQGNHFDVKAFSIHPKYKGSESNANDIAIIELATTIHFTKVMRPIALPGRNEKFEHIIGRKLTVVGWGETSNNTDTNVLMKAKILISPEEHCKQYDASYSTNEFICGGNLEKSICEGDSGGPLIFKKDEKFVIVGVAAFGIGTGCGAPGAPSYFTRVSTYSEWIDDVVHNSGN